MSYMSFIGTVVDASGETADWVRGIVNARIKQAENNNNPDDWNDYNAWQVDCTREALESMGEWDIVGRKDSLTVYAMQCEHIDPDNAVWVLWSDCPAGGWLEWQVVEKLQTIAPAAVPPGCSVKLTD